MTMTRFDNILSLVLSVSILVLLSAPTTTRAADPGPAAGINVNVVNTPLPVTGNVNVTGNSATNPLFVSDVNNPTRSPISADVDSINSFHVPANRLLVIEWVSISCLVDVSSPATVVELGTGLNGHGVDNTFFPKLIRSAGGSLNQYATSE